MSEIPQTPVNIPTFKRAIAASFVAIALVLVLTVSIGGSLIIASQAVNRAQAAQAALTVREEQSSVRTAIPTCKALLAMDDASHGAKFPHYPGVPQDQGYGVRLSVAIHNLYVTTRCNIILSGKPIPVIVKELEHHG